MCVSEASLGAGLALGLAAGAEPFDYRHVHNYVRAAWLEQDFRIFAQNQEHQPELARAIAHWRTESCRSCLEVSFEYQNQAKGRQIYDIEQL